MTAFDYKIELTLGGGEVPEFEQVNDEPQNIADEEKQFLDTESKDRKSETASLPADEEQKQPVLQTNIFSSDIDNRVFIKLSYRSKNNQRGFLESMDTFKFLLQFQGEFEGSEVEDGSDWKLIVSNTVANTLSDRKLLKSPKTNKVWISAHNFGATVEHVLIGFLEGGPCVFVWHFHQK